MLGHVKTTHRNSLVATVGPITIIIMVARGPVPRIVTATVALAPMLIIPVVAAVRLPVRIPDERGRQGTKLAGFLLLLLAPLLLLVVALLYL